MAEQLGLDQPGRKRRDIEGVVLRAEGFDEPLLVLVEWQIARIADGLRDSALDSQDLPDALSNVARQWTAGSPIEVRVDVSGERRKLPHEMEQHLLRIAQEAVTNSLKHARHFVRNVRAGMVMTNLPTAGVDYHVPFGGTRQSSFGPREQGFAAVEFYTQVKTSYTWA